MENNWIENVTGKCPVACGTLVDVTYRDNEIKTKLIALESAPGRDASEPYWKVDYQNNDIVKWRLHKSEQSLDDALGLPVGVTPYVYPKTTFKPSSEAQLRADEAERISNKLHNKLVVVAFTANEVTGKNFSPADIKLVKDLLESVEDYEENR